jgi:hypothetical protein
VDLAGYRARVRRLTGLRLESLLTDADLDATVNETYAELAGMYPWPQFHFEDSEPVTAGDARVTLPAAVRSLSSVVLDGERLRQTTRDELDRLDDEDGLPFAYAMVSERELVLYPTPDEDGTLELRGQRIANRLQHDKDVPLFEVEFHPVIAWVAAARLLAEEGDDSGRREAYASEAAELLGRMRERYLTSDDGGLFVLGGAGRRHPRTQVRR